MWRAGPYLHQRTDKGFAAKGSQLPVNHSQQDMYMLQASAERTTQHEVHTRPQACR
jgi:hypothetical protein